MIVIINVKYAEELNNLFMLEAYAYKRVKLWTERHEKVIVKFEDKKCFKFLGDSILCLFSKKQNSEPLHSALVPSLIKIS